MEKKIPLIAHVVYRLDVGGLENGLINLINNMPSDMFSHVIVCLTTYTQYSERIKQKNVSIYSLNKKSGKDLTIYWKLYLLFKKLKPTIVHTRNIATLEAQLPAYLAGIKVRIHSEHGREGIDLFGNYWKYNYLRKLFRPIICKYIALSKELEVWMCNQINIPKNKIVQIYNGVDTNIFIKKNDSRNKIYPEGFLTRESIIIGTVGRMAVVKDQITLLRSFVLTRSKSNKYKQQLRLVLVGDGPLEEKIKKYIYDNDLSGFVWLPGQREDIPNILNNLDIFVLPSRGEGISNTILEAMACSKPIVATNVGGNSELVLQDKTGLLIEKENPTAMSLALLDYIDNPEKIQKHGMFGRKRVEELFSIDHMIVRYSRLYKSLLLNSRKEH